MTSGRDLIDNNWKAAECAFYGGGTEVARTVALGSALTGQWWGTIGASAVGLAFNYAAGLAGCDEDPSNPEQGSPGDIPGCKRTDNGAGILVDGATGEDLPGAGNGNLNEILSYERTSGGLNNWTVRSRDGQVSTFSYYPPQADTAYLRLIFGDCAESGPSPEPLPPDAIGRPTTVDDGDCTWTITPKDSYIDASGSVRTYYVLEANNESCGGPFAYWSGPDGPTPVNPSPPDRDPDSPDPPTPIPPPEPCPCTGDDDDGTGSTPMMGPAEYVMTGVCEQVAQGEEQPEFLYGTPGGIFYEELGSRIDQLALMLQKHLELRTPICSGKSKEGDFRTISFISDEYPPGGRNYLRKLFRYRSTSGVGLTGLVDHWKSFSWQAGPVCVQHKDAYWGSPQVWAATAEEGKRVIRHAAVEAGLDPDQAGRWIIGGSDNPRFGVSGTMRVNTSGGYYWITERLGSNARPLVEQI